MELKIDSIADKLAKIDNFTFSVGCIILWVGVACLLALFFGVTC